MHLSNSIPNFSSFEKRNYTYVEFQSVRHKIILNKKFSSFLNLTLYVPLTAPFVENSVVNLPFHPFTDSQSNLLSLSVNFSRTYKVSIPEPVAPIAHSFKNSKISPDQQNSLRFLLSNVIFTYNGPQKSDLSSSQKSALRPQFNYD